MSVTQKTVKGDPFSKEGGLNQEEIGGLDIQFSNTVEEEVEAPQEKESAVDTIRNAIFKTNKEEIRRKEKAAKQEEALRKKQEQRERRGEGFCGC